MNSREQYIKRIVDKQKEVESTENKLKEQKEELQRLKEEYADRYARFKKGTKVKVTTPAHTVRALTIMTGESTERHPSIEIPEEIKYGFVDHNIVSEDNRIIPVLYVCKKDGTRGKYKLYYSKNSILEEA